LRLDRSAIVDADHLDSTCSCRQHRQGCSRCWRATPRPTTRSSPCAQDIPLSQSGASRHPPRSLGRRTSIRQRTAGNVLNTLRKDGDLAGAAELAATIAAVDQAIATDDYRAANICAGYVYVISNVGAFGRDGEGRNDPPPRTDGSGPRTGRRVRSFPV